MSVGNPLLDKQHAVLLKLAATLLQDAATASDAALHALLNDICDLAGHHCAAEEHLLMLNGFEWLEQHSQDHAAGLDRLHRLRDRLVAGQATREQVGAAVADWIVYHLEEMDQPARDYLGASRPMDYDEPLDPSENGYP